MEKEHYQIFFKWVMHYSVYNGMATADMVRLTGLEPSFHQEADLLTHSGSCLGSD